MANELQTPNGKTVVFWESNSYIPEDVEEVLQDVLRVLKDNPEITVGVAQVSGNIYKANLAGHRATISKMQKQLDVVVVVMNIQRYGAKILQVVNSIISKFSGKEIQILFADTVEEALDIVDNL